VLVVISLLLAAAMLALYSLQVASRSPAGRATGGFAADYQGELADFRTATAALQVEGQAAVGQGLEKVLPVYQHLQQATEAAAGSFAALKPPASAKADYARFLQLLRQQTATLGAVVAAVKTDQTRQLGASLQHYAALVSDWLTIRQRIDAAVR
jgi:hypothetical protein